jgi:Cysteine-rich CPXCG
LEQVMDSPGENEFGDDDEEDVDPDVLPHDVVLDTEAEVACPYCGEIVVLGLDPGGGAVQEYVEDCQVCCRPCRVRVSYGDTGAAEVRIEETQ